MNTLKEDTNKDDAEEEEKNISIRKATDVMLSLSKAIKALKLYPDNSPIRHKFINDLKSKFANFLEEHGDLKLTVRQFDLLYEGEVVYSQEVKEDSIAFKFFGDGIREIAFYEGLNEQEIFNFIDVIEGKTERDEEDNDLVTLLWEKDFQNIRYVIIEDSGDNEGGQAAQNSSETTSGLAPGTTALKSAHEAESKTGHAGGEAANQTPGIELEIEQIYGKPFGEIFVLTPDEIEKVKEEMNRDAGSDLIFEMLDILFHILAIEEDAASYKEIMTYIEKAIKTMILSGDYNHALGALNKIKDMSENDKGLSPDHIESAKNVIDALGEEDFLQQLTVSLNSSKSDNIDELYTIFTMLNEKAILPLTTMLSTLEQMKSRRMICDALVLIAKDNLDTILKKLHDDNWFIVRNIVYVLGRIGDAKVVNHIKRIKDHKESKVRKEIIHTLAEIKSDEAKNILVSYLKDADNTVRVSALKRIISLEHQRAVPVIMQIISSEDFDSKENYEKKELFEALAILGGQDQLAFLKEMLLKKSWLFGKAKLDEMRYLSAHALSKMNVSGAIDILREGASSSDKVTKKICEDALRGAGKGGV